MSRSHRFAALLVGLSLLASSSTSLGSDNPPATGSTVPSDPVFNVLLTDATTESGRIRQIGPDHRLTLATEKGEDRVIPFDRIVKLTHDEVSPPIPPEGPFVLFPDGDRLRATIGASGETTLDVQSFCAGDLKIPLDSMLGLILNPPTEPDALDALISLVRTEPRTAEILLLANGDRVAGGFLGIGQGKISFQPETGKIELERAGVLALGFDPKLVEYPRPKEAFLELTFADGSRLGVTKARIEKGHIHATTRFNVPIKAAIGELARLHVRSDSVKYLSERPEFGVQYVTYIGPSRPYRRDATVDGHPFRLSGKTYDRGLGMQSRTLLAYKLNPGDRRFQALVGLDDRAGPLGGVVFRVVVDGKVRYASPPMSARDEPKLIDLDVADAKTLILLTEFGERGEVRDLADWIEARLIR